MSGGPGRDAPRDPPEDLGDQPGDRGAQQQRFHDELLGILIDLRERFGDREPADEEVRAFLRERLVAEGRTPAEAEDFLAGLDDAAQG